MKKALITMTTLALLGATAPRTQAGNNCGWAVAGKVLTGVGAGLILAKALEPQPVYAAAPVYVTPAPIMVQQAPVVLQQPMQTVTTIAQPVVVQQPVIVQAAPVIYQPAPVVYAAPIVVRPYYAPPVVSVGFRFGPGYRGHGYRHW